MYASDDNDDVLPIDTPAARLHALAGSLYYVAQVDHGYETERVFEALPHVDQLFFESLMALALEAALHWRRHDDRVTVTMPSRPVLALVRRTVLDDRLPLDSD